MNKKEEPDFQSLGFKSLESYEFPNILNLEVYRGDCPSNCVHCPVGRIEPSKRRERFGDKGIDLQLYRKIVKEVSQYPHSAVRVHSVGDPINWENLVEALELTHNMNVNSWIFTCAVTDDISLLEAICKNTDIVEVSVNSSSEKDYLATKGTNAFRLVKGNIERMHDFISQNNLPTHLIASRVQSIDAAADEEFIRYWKSTGKIHDAFVRSHHTYNDLMPELAVGGQLKHEPCLVHWARFNISVNGYAVVCFNELFKEHLNPLLILGDINKQTIAEVWQGKKLKALREAELSGNYSKLDFSRVLPCKDCYSCQPLYGSRQTSEHQIRQLRK